MAAAVFFGAAAAAVQVLVAGDLAYTGLYAMVVTTIVVMSRAIRRTQSPGVGTWWFAVVGLGFMGAGSFALGLVEPYLETNPMWYLVPGVIWVGGYLCYMVTESLLVSFHWRRGYDRAMVLDAVVVFVAVMVPVIELLARPTFSQPGPFLVRALNTSYVVFDGLMVVLLAQLILTGDRRNPSLWFIVAAVSSVVVGDFAVILVGTIVDIRYLAAFIILCYVFMQLTVLHPQLSGITDPVREFDNRLDKTRAIILGVALMTVPITLVLATAGPGAVDTWFLVVAAGAVAVLVLVRLTWLFADRETAQQAVETRERYFRALVSNIGDVISVVDHQGRVQYVSPSGARLFGRLMAPGARAFQFVHPEDREVVDSLFSRSTAEPGCIVTGELRATPESGGQVWLEVTMQNLLDDADVANIVVTCHDVTERHVLEDELRHEAFHDALTGLPNRALALDRLDRLVQRSRRGNTNIGVAFVDVDKFKSINDTLGHSAGDELLRGVSERLSLAVRPSDTVARLGGDEFLVLLELGDGPGVDQVGRRLVESFSEPFTLAGREVAVTISVGMASSTRVPSGDELLRQADVALYRAKASGRNAYAVYRADMDSQSGDEAEMPAELEQAVESGEQFRVHFQPVVDLESGRACGVEALVRWEHPRRGLLPAAVFVPVAEASGAIVPLGRWVLAEACRQAAMLLPDDIELSVNISTRQLESEGFVESVAAALAASWLPARRLMLEVTEQTFTAGPAVLDRLAELDALGVRLAVDNFGGGSVPLASLADLHVDTVKLGRQFMVAVSEDTEAARLTMGLLDTARTAGLRTVAGCVEELGQASLLRNGGCEFAQGFLFAKPAPPAEVVAAMHWESPHSVA